MAIDEIELKNILLNELGYKPTQVDAVLEKLNRMSQDIYKAFEVWFTNKEFLSTPEYGGVTPKMLHESYAFLQPPAVFLLLDWIKREPVRAMVLTTHEFGPIKKG